MDQVPSARVALGYYATVCYDEDALDCDKAEQLRCEDVFKVPQRQWAWFQERVGDNMYSFPVGCLPPIFRCQDERMCQGGSLGVAPWGPSSAAVRRQGIFHSVVAVRSGRRLGHWRESLALAHPVPAPLPRVQPLARRSLQDIRRICRRFRTWGRIRRVVSWP